jgi:cytochrome d ubiquinol oxidase subunit I
MLFGWGRVSERMHFVATCAVCLGTTISAGWILAANSWMQTPAGYSLQNGRFIVESWLHAIFNPSYLYRYPHMLLASYLTAAFVVAAVGAWYFLKRRHLAFARLNLSVGLGAAGVLILCQVFLGDLLAGVMAEHQPSKIQAIEGHWDDASSAPYLFYVHPNQKEQRNESSWGVPLLGSVLVTHSLDGTVPGLKRTPPAEQPPMGWVFYAFRVMFVLGTFMFIAAFVGTVLRWRGKLYSTPWYHRWLVAMAPAGSLATVGGWYTAEIGRQPWVIYGLLRTHESVSPVTAGSVAVALALLVVVYGTLFVTYFALLFRRIGIGPEAAAVPALSPEENVRRSRGIRFEEVQTP